MNSFHGGALDEQRYNHSAMLIATCLLREGELESDLGGQAANTTISPAVGHTIASSHSPHCGAESRKSCRSCHAREKWRREGIGRAFWLVLIGETDFRLF